MFRGRHSCRYADTYLDIENESNGCGQLGDLESLALDIWHYIRDGSTGGNQSGQGEQNGVVEVPEHAKEHHKYNVCKNESINKR